MHAYLRMVSPIPTFTYKYPALYRGTHTSIIYLMWNHNAGVVVCIPPGCEKHAERLQIKIGDRVDYEVSGMTILSESTEVVLNNG